VTGPDASPVILEDVDRAGSRELLSDREFAGSGVPFPSRDSEDLLVILRVFVESGVSFDSSAHILVPDEVGEFVWPSIWVIVLANWCLRVTVLTVVRYLCGGWSSSGCRLLGCVAWLAG
jgi:hypothetical protein